MLRVALLALTLLSAAPLAPAAAQAVAEEHGAEGAHAVSLHTITSLENKPFWAAILNFALLAYLLRRYGAKPLREFLVGRRREIEQAMAEAGAMKQKAEAKYKEYTERLATLDQELAKLRSDIERSAEEDKRKIVAEAEETARRLKRETESLIDQHAKALTSAVRQEMVGAAVAAAEKLLLQALTDADQQRLAQTYNQEIAAERPQHAGARAPLAQPGSRAEGQP
jgi:F0F1-type ATP synthase membrane subunit b/b'